MYQPWTSRSPLSIPVCYSITTDEWKSAIEFLTRAGQISSTHREFHMLSHVLGVSALVETLNNPQVGNATPSSFLGPFFTEDAPDRSSLLTSSACADPNSTHLSSRISHRFATTKSRLASQSHRRERVNTCTSRDVCLPPAESPFQARSSRHGRRTARVSRIRMPFPYPLLDDRCAACISWPPLGLYDVQYTGRIAPECRGRLRTNGEGKYGYRAVVPVPYFIRRDVQSSFLCTFCFRDSANLHLIGPGGRAASHSGTTQRPAESPARGDRRPQIPQAHDGIVPRRRPVSLERCHLW